jgi:hypothetical protein
MRALGIFVAGFATGWVVRSAVDSSRSLAVSGVSAAFGTVERLRRLLAIEKEHLEDLVAEGKAKHASKLRRDGLRPEAPSCSPTPPVASVRAA